MTELENNTITVDTSQTPESECVGCHRILKKDLLQTYTLDDCQYPICGRCANQKTIPQIQAAIAIYNKKQK